MRLIVSMLTLWTGLMSIAAAQTASKKCDLSQRRIVMEVTAAVPLSKAWALWTTKDGLQKFFGPEAEIDPRVGGEFSIHFFPDNARGQRGAEDMIILAYEPQTRLAFTWNAPVMFPHARRQFSVVTVTFAPTPEGGTKVRLMHDHFGEGPDWDETFDYFSQAWSVQVMPYFLYAAEHGSVTWGSMSVEPTPVSIEKCRS